MNVCLRETAAVELRLRGRLSPSGGRLSPRRPVGPMHRATAEYVLLGTTDFLMAQCADDEAPRIDCPCISLWDAHIGACLLPQSRGQTAKTSLSTRQRTATARDGAGMCVAARRPCAHGPIATDTRMCARRLAVYIKNK